LIEIIVNFLGLFGIFLAGFGILTSVTKAMDFEGKILNMYKPSEVGWAMAILLVVVGVALVGLAQYYAKKNEMV
jgi:hypothetical protein